ncbi:MAG TPA: 7TM diverse intracellular signaling domain-containing protein [Xanthomonadales bacterium]|nr:7TM diverse intracellular signaling domain-containing protein [Xanthomonadales bacterium]
MDAQRLHRQYARPIAARLALALLLVAAALALPGPARALDLVRDSDRVELAGELRYYHDSRGSMSLEDARARAHRFEPVTRWPPTFGFAPGAHWFHLEVRNASHPEPDWVLAIRYALLDHADLYVVADDGRVREYQSGDRVPYVQRLVDHRHITFPVNLEAGQGAGLWLRVASESSVQVPLELTTERAFLEPASIEHLALGAYYGIMLGLFLYNLILFVSLRDRTFLLYVVYVATFAMGQFCLNGLAFQHLWPRAPDWANDVVLVTVAASLVAMLAFARAFLDLKHRLPRTDRIFLAIMGVLALLALGIPLLGYRLTITLETAIVFVMAGLILYAALRVYAAGYRPARNFLIAWAALLAGVTTYAAVSFGLLPKVFVTEYGIQIGSAAEMILLSFALADRINSLREENARIQREAQDLLEHRVIERTRDLDDANRQLQAVNRMLQDFSLRDGLTGAYNRRYFDQALTELWAAARAGHKPISLVMVDIDHFKQINDTHGHLHGDDCLRAVAQTLTLQLQRAGERVVRYGGEEFFVILPDAGEAEAAARAEQIRAAVAALQLDCGGEALSITISVGVATFHPETALAYADLLQITDRALYEAKRQGRNRVVAGNTRREPAGST